MELLARGELPYLTEVPSAEHRQGKALSIRGPALGCSRYSITIHVIIIVIHDVSCQVAPADGFIITLPLTVLKPLRPSLRTALPMLPMLRLLILLGPAGCIIPASLIADTQIPTFPSKLPCKMA